MLEDKESADEASKIILLGKVQIEKGKQMLWRSKKEHNPAQSLYFPKL